MNCYRLTAAALLLCSLFSFPVAGRAGEVGVFLDNQADCAILSSAGNGSCRKDGAIWAGDLIRTKGAPGALAIQWLAPGYTRLEPLAAGQYRVSFTAPQETSGVLAMLGDLVGFARKAGRISHSAVTRGALDPQPMLPGDGATLLPGRPVTFSWCAPGVSKIVIATGAGVKLKELAVPLGDRSLTLQPADLGLAGAGVYRWTPVHAAAEGGRIVLLGEAAAKPVSEALLAIEKGEGTAAEQGLKELAYLQFVSDNYPDDYSLGGMQYRLVDELSPKLAADDRAAAERFKAASGVRYCR